MLPPFDSFGHQARKLAEVFAEGQKSRSLTSVPPPPYSSAIETPSSNTEGNNDLDCDSDHDDDVSLEDDASSSAAPITIKIDASISLVGDRNTIAIPPIVSRLVRSSINQEGRRDSNNGLGSQTQCPNLSEQQSPSSISESASGSGSGSAGQASTYLQGFQQQRHTQYAELTNTIIAGLNSAGLLTDPINGSSRPRRLAIEINSAIRIQGTGNVICAGMLPRNTARNNTDANTKTNSDLLSAPATSVSDIRKETNPSTAGAHTHSLTELELRRKRSNSV
jgi:hypothetical protein